ncbi:uncharacterized protein LOC135142604 isoform X2 [Zophobas morio]|uniref:uncharacterized protein LOC135142604 isoform X2 n=1 Tax=Zophobas morio TaxID=2755281 RepID=UPI003082DE3B
MTFLLITLYAFLVAVSFGGKLPSGFKKCNLKQTSSRLCLPKAIESALRQMDRPIKSLGLVSLEPLVIPSLTIDAGSQYVAAKHTYQNLRVSGFNETTCSKAEFNYNEKTLNLDCVVPNFRMDFNYEIHGQILMTSVFGNGTGWIIFQSADRVKKILKENVLEIYGDLRDGYEEAFGKIFAYIFEKVLENVPVSDIFG